MFEQVLFVDYMNLTTKKEEILQIKQIKQEWICKVPSDKSKRIRHARKSKK